MALDSSYTTVTKEQALEQLASNQPPRTIVPRRIRNAIGTLFDRVENINLSIFTNTTPGTVPASGGGTNKYLDSDGTWKTLPQGEISTAQNTGSGVGIFRQKVSATFEFKSLINGNNISFINNPDSITINVSGLSSVATSGSYNDLSNRPNLSTVATSGSYNDLSNRPVLSNVAISNSYLDLDNRPNLSTVATSGSYNDLSNRPVLSNVATSGSYNDLVNLPELNSQIIILTQSRTLQLTDNRNYLRYSGSNEITITVPSNSEIPLPINSSVSLRKAGTGDISIVASNDVIINSNLEDLIITNQHTGITLIKVSENEWDLIGLGGFSQVVRNLTFDSTQITFDSTQITFDSI